MCDRQAVLLEGLDRVMDSPRDYQVWVAAADVEVTRQVGGAVSRTRVSVWVRWRRSVDLRSHDVGGRIFLRLLQLDVCELRDADGSNNGPPLWRVGIWRGAVEAGAQMKGVLVMVGRSAILYSYFWLAVNQRVRSAVGVRIPDVQISHGVALPMLLRQNHAPRHAPVLLPHHCLVIRSGAIGGWDERAVAMGGNEVWPGDVTRNGGVGGHGRGLMVVLGIVQ